MRLMELYDLYYQRVRKVILNMVRNEWVADDLVQETFIRVNNNLDNLKDTSKMSSWIFRIAYNLCQDHFRRRGKISSTSDEEILEDMTPPLVPTAQKELERGQMRQCVYGLVNHLPDSLRSVLILADVNEFTNREIAEIMEISVENVKIRLHRARKKLKILLEEHCVFERDERNVLTCQPEKEKGYNLFLKPPSA